MNIFDSCFFEITGLPGYEQIALQKLLANCKNLSFLSYVGALFFTYFFPKHCCENFFGSSSMCWNVTQSKAKVFGDTKELLSTKV